VNCPVCGIALPIPRSGGTKFANGCALLSERRIARPRESSFRKISGVLWRVHLEYAHNACDFGILGNRPLSFQLRGSDQRFRGLQGSHSMPLGSRGGYFFAAALTFAHRALCATTIRLRAEADMVGPGFGAVSASNLVSKNC
jgi:hypothetical protein